MVITSIDLISGKSVQLRQGKEKILERGNVLNLAKDFNRYGETAVIDLDAAMNKGDNLETIEEILGVAECRVGGGIRTIEKAKELISFGANKVIIGSMAFKNNRINVAFLDELAQKIDRRNIIIAIDALNGEIVTEAWTHGTGIFIPDAIIDLEKYCAEFLFTCVEREGTMKGFDFEAAKRLQSLTNNKITVAGGIHSIGEIKKCAQLGFDVQVGMALYTGKIDLADAFVGSLNWHSSLIPTVTQDDSGQVLMLAYSSKESLRKTFETNRMWYFSRSRDRLWMKGETSNNIQELIKLRADCDHDAILATVKQKGWACHTGRYSCFGPKNFSFEELHGIIMDRLENPTPASYTAKLTDRLLKEKMLEECTEVIKAESRDALVSELADVSYFLTVLMAKSDIRISDVLRELRRRRK